ncbi:TetR/AcrR family transcriptional regulator [Nocardia amikacinitolerans]|nr:TetR/AcrR family transcriptional regulator [Nocardia amikacinitolerans]
MSTLGRSASGAQGMSRAERERQILDAATVEFGRRGYAYASLTDIASAAGVSRPLLYAYFGSRDGLHSACVRQAGSILIDSLSRVRSDSGAQGDYPSPLATIFIALERRTQYWSTIYDHTLPRSSPGYAAAQEFQHVLTTMSALCLPDTIADADSDDRSLLHALWFSTISTTISWWSERPDKAPQEMVERWLRLLAPLSHAATASGPRQLDYALPTRARRQGCGSRHEPR